jgi:hypothetical protein
MKKFVLLILLFHLLVGFANNLQDSIPIIYNDYGVHIRHVKTFGDTIRYNLSSKEDFKLVIFSPMGNSYLEHYVKGQLVESGYYENSLDTLKRYVSGRGLNGNHGPIKIQKYFEPLKNGAWLTYKNGKIIKRQVFLLGIPQN